MTKKLDGLVAVVTGSGQGVGRGIAIVLAREGARIVTNNRKPYMQGDATVGTNLTEAERQKLLSIREDAEGTANEIVAEGGQAVPFYGNVADYETAGKLIQKAIDTYGRIDILVNNAAGLGSGMLVNTSEADWDYQTVAKLKGAFNCMRHAVPFMMQQKFGRIINVASDAWIGMNNLSAYSAANAGLVGLTKATAKELYRAGVTVNAICPQAASPGHFVEFTAMMKTLHTLGVKVDEARMKKVEDDHGPAENMAPFVAYLATKEAATVSGAVFAITASGRIALFSEPAEIQSVKKDDTPWTMDELIKEVPEKLLKDYKSIASINVFG
ncbi:MAG: SDR family NAD(P)-dependent oxidoreductase [Anaerolineales bacterium]|jgi:3-oxoacyl-[acyl-carrier protein] reductase